MTTTQTVAETIQDDLKFITKIHLKTIDAARKFHTKTSIKDQQTHLNYGMTIMIIEIGMPKNEPEPEVVRLTELIGMIEMDEKDKR